jgi:hypothetical protein
MMLASDAVIAAISHRHAVLYTSNSVVTVPRASLTATCFSARQSYSYCKLLYTVPMSRFLLCSAHMHDRDRGL